MCVDVMGIGWGMAALYILVCSGTVVIMCINQSGGQYSA